jgi:hypothetical protein
VEVLIFNAPESIDFIPGEPLLLVDPTVPQMVALQPAHPFGWQYFIEELFPCVSSRALFSWGW